MQLRFRETARQQKAYLYLNITSAILRNGFYCLFSKVLVCIVEICGLKFYTIYYFDFGGYLQILLHHFQNTIYKFYNL